MTYLNGNDMPEHVKLVLKDVITNGKQAAVTAAWGNAVLISKDEYERLLEQSDSEAILMSDYGHFRRADPMERFFREEIDY